jgi:hypothetical protein
MIKAMVCASCGSENGVKDPYARWDIAAQDWVVSGVHSNSMCLDCGDQRDPKIVEINSSRLRAQSNRPR